MGNQHVYCTNCKHFKINEGVPYCEYDAKGLCDVTNCEDSRPLSERPCYEGMKDILFCLVGASGSGKTSVAYALQEKYGYNVIESYTTRPKRHEGEKGHIFVDEFQEAWNPFPWIEGKALPGDVIAYNEYNGYEYWATRGQYQGKGISLYVVDVPGVKMLRETVKDAEIVVIALWADADTRWDRLCERGDNQTAIIERIAYDNKAFAVIPCDYSVDANADIDTVAERVNSIIEGIAKQ